MGFLITLVTLNNPLQNYSSTNRHATIQSQSLIVQFRKIFSFRKCPAKISLLIVSQSSLPPVISQNMKQPDISTDDIL